MTGLESFIELLSEKSELRSSVSHKNAQLQKEVIKYFMKNEKLMITEIAKKTKTSVPKIKEIIDEFLENELILDLGKEIIGVGRKPNFYGLNSNAGFFLSIEVNRHHVTLALINFKEEIVHVVEHMPFELQNTKTKFEELCGIIDEYLISHQEYSNKIIGIGLTITGRVNHRSGDSFSFFNFHDRPLSEVLTARYKLPAYVENDTRAMAYGEFAKGCVTTEKNVLFLNLNEGIGMGIIINGKLYSGKSGFAGEFGHLTILSNDIICHCGKKGCLETEASGAALVKQVTAAIKTGTSTILTEGKHPQNMTLTDIVDAALKDDTLCIELIGQAGEKIGKGIALMLNLFNPELIILGGELSRAGSLILLPILSTINKHSLNLVNTDTEFRFSKLQQNAGPVGVAMLLRNALLNGDLLCD